MTITIDINHSQRTLAAGPGTTLLKALNAGGVFLPSACGGRAICGMCKVKVSSGAGPLTAGEERLLSDAEKRSSVRLACQVRTDADLAVEIPAALFRAHRFRARTLSLRALTPDTRELRLRLIAPGRMEFRAGQFVQLLIPAGDGALEETPRAYSIASPPSQADEIELAIRLVPNGIAAGYIERRLHEGDELSLIGPMGDFGLREGDADMVLIAGGSGMAPMKSILTDMCERNIKKRSVWFFFGAVERRDLFYTDYFAALEQRWPGFHFVPALSAPAEGDGWTGEVGLIPDVAGRFLADRIGPGAPREAYLCGSPGFINASLKMLERAGVARERIYFDRFV